MSSATTETPRFPVRRTCPHTTIANAWNTVFATFGWTPSKTVISSGPVPSSSVRKMIRWLLRIAGVCEETFTPATITHSSARHFQTSCEYVTPRSRNSGPKKLATNGLAGPGSGTSYAAAGTTSSYLWGIFWDDSGAKNDDNHDDFIAVARYRSTAVPEPSTMFLLGAGLLGFAALRRRAKH